MTGLRYHFAYMRGWVAWIFVVKVCPVRFVADLPGAVLGWAGFYAYDRRHDRAGDA